MYIWIHRIGMYMQRSTLANKLPCTSDPQPKIATRETPNAKFFLDSAGTNKLTMHPGVQCCYDHALCPCDKHGASTTFPDTARWCSAGCVIGVSQDCARQIRRPGRSKGKREASFGWIRVQSHDRNGTRTTTRTELQPDFESIKNLSTV